MDQLNEQEIWRGIPAEEKFEIMTKAQARGVHTALCAILIAFTISISLKIALVVITVLVISPFIFQITSQREWKRLRPKVMLDYLAARAASRRFAFALKSQDLSTKLIFKGTLVEHRKENDLPALPEQFHDEMEHTVNQVKKSSVWVSLLGDAFVIMSEHAGGAMLNVGGLLDDSVEVRKQASEDEEGDTSITIKITGEKEKHFVLTSPYKEALSTFDKKLNTQQQNLVAEQQNLQKYLSERSPKALLSAPSPEQS